MAWIARDLNGNLYLYRCKPYRKQNQWYSHNICQLLPKNADRKFFFTKISWLNEPIKIILKI